jgi:hypothetical protein
MLERWNERVSKVGWTSQDSTQSVDEDVGSDRDPQQKVSKGNFFMAVRSVSHHICPF